MAKLIDGGAIGIPKPPSRSQPGVRLSRAELIIAAFTCVGE